MIDRAHQSGSRDDRAVSDVLAFILVFSIIITSVGLVYTFGMGALGDAQVSEQNRNAERAFETMAVSFSDLQTGRGEERLSQLNPRGGRIRVDDGTQLTVSVDNPSRSVVTDQNVGSLDYNHEGTEISYELGATFRADDGNSIMIRQPEFVCTAGDTDRAVLSYPALTGSQPSSVSTSSTLRIRAERTSSRVRYPTDRVGGSNDRSVDSLTVRIDSSTHADAWERYFNENGWNSVVGPSTGDDYVEATCNTDTAYVRETGVSVGLL